MLSVSIGWAAVVITCVFYSIHIPTRMRARERPAARIADMRLLSRVYPHVIRQVAGLRERLAACLTDMLCSHVWWGGKGGQGNGEDQFNSKVDKLFFKKKLAVCGSQRVNACVRGKWYGASNAYTRHQTQTIIQCVHTS